MTGSKKKIVFAAEAEQIEQIQAVVSTGRCRNTSEFLREAIDEKLQQLRRERIAEQVERYCSEDYDGDEELIASQAFDSDE